MLKTYTEHACVQAMFSIMVNHNKWQCNNNKW